MKTIHLHLVSDSTGETVSSVARAAMAQFDGVEAEEHLWTLVRTKSQLEKVITHLEAEPGPVMVTLVEAELRDIIRKTCQRLGQPCIFILQTAISELSSYLGQETKARAGKQHELTEDYFQRVEAINFALAHDDGQAYWDLDDAEIVLVGPSRTSKSPTCVYLAYRGFKAANVPYVYGCPLPQQLMDLKKTLIVGLTIGPDRLQQIRRTRLQSLKQEEETNYADGEYIQKEIEESRKLFHQNKWPVIDVTKRSVEETAATIVQYLQRFREKQEKDT